MFDGFVSAMVDGRLGTVSGFRFRSMGERGAGGKRPERRAAAASALCVKNAALHSRLGGQERTHSAWPGHCGATVRFSTDGAPGKFDGGAVMAAHTPDAPGKPAAPGTRSNASSSLTKLAATASGWRAGCGGRRLRPTSFIRRAWRCRANTGARRPIASIPNC